MLAISEKTIYSYASRGMIPYVKIESNLRFHPEQIRSWLADRTHALHPGRSDKKGK